MLIISMAYILSFESITSIQYIWLELGHHIDHISNKIALMYHTGWSTVSTYLSTIYIISEFVPVTCGIILVFIMIYRYLDSYSCITREIIILLIKVVTVDVVCQIGLKMPKLISNTCLFCIN